MRKSSMATPVNTIRRVGGEGGCEYTYYPILIIGAGASGIAVGCRLRQVLHTDQFRIVDRRAGLGGVWYTNRYPGVASDIPAICCSYSFAQKSDWTTWHPSGSEILEYLRHTCMKFQIVDKIQLNTNVTSIRWLDEEKEWEVTLSCMVPGAGDLTSAERKKLAATRGPESVIRWTERARAKIVVSCVGAPVEPKSVPDIPGIESFKGHIVHAARWDSSISLSGKHVIVVGTGSSAAQITPAVLKPEFGAKSVIQVMRPPTWVEPTLSPENVIWWTKWMPWLCSHIPGFQKTLRKVIFATSELEFSELFSPSERSRQKRRDKAKELLDYLHKAVPEKYHDMLTPNYEVFCKCCVIDTRWFRSLQDSQVELTSLPLASIQENGVTLGPDKEYPPANAADGAAPSLGKQVSAEIIIFADGYGPGEWLHPLDVTGKGGRSLFDLWEQRGGAQAYRGIALDGFPNFFTIHGPNTVAGHSSVTLAAENMVNYSLRFIKPILNGDVESYEVRESAERHWTNEIQEHLKRSVWMSGGGTSRYFKENGWNTALYPRSQIDFTLRCMFPKYSDWNATYTRQGLRKYHLRLGLRRPKPSRQRPFTQATTGGYGAVPNKGAVLLSTLPDHDSAYHTDESSYEENAKPNSCDLGPESHGLKPEPPDLESVLHDYRAELLDQKTELPDVNGQADTWSSFPESPSIGLKVEQFDIPGSDNSGSVAYFDLSDWSEDLTWQIQTIGRTGSQIRSLPKRGSTIRRAAGSRNKQRDSMRRHMGSVKTPRSSTRRTTGSRRRVPDASNSLPNSEAGQSSLIIEPAISPATPSSQPSIPSTPIEEQPESATTFITWPTMEPKAINKQAASVATPTTWQTMPPGVMSEQAEFTATPATSGMSLTFANEPAVQTSTPSSWSSMPSPFVSELTDSSPPPSRGSSVPSAFVSEHSDSSPRPSSRSSPPSSLMNEPTDTVIREPSWVKFPPSPASTPAPRLNRSPVRRKPLGELIMASREEGALVTGSVARMGNLAVSEDIPLEPQSAPVEQPTGPGIQQSVPSSEVFESLYGPACTPPPVPPKSRFRKLNLTSIERLDENCLPMTGETQSRQPSLKRQPSVPRGKRPPSLAKRVSWGDSISPGNTPTGTRTNLHPISDMENDSWQDSLGNPHSRRAERPSVQAEIKPLNITRRLDWDYLPSTTTHLAGKRCSVPIISSVGEGPWVAAGSRVNSRYQPHSVVSVPL